MSKLNKRYVACAFWGGEHEPGESHVPILAKNKKDALKTVSKKLASWLTWTVYSVDEWFEKFGIIHED